MTTGMVLLVVTVVAALIFDFLNGLHDAANSIATIVSTRVLSPRLAVLWAAFFNFIAFSIFCLPVARNLGSGIIEGDIIDPRLIFGPSVGRLPGTSLPGSAVSLRAVRMR